MIDEVKKYRRLEQECSLLEEAELAFSKLIHRLNQIRENPCNVQLVQDLMANQFIFNCVTGAETASRQIFENISERQSLVEGLLLKIHQVKIGDKIEFNQTATKKALMQINDVDILVSDDLESVLILYGSLFKKDGTIGKRSVSTFLQIIPANSI